MMTRCEKSVSATQKGIIINVEQKTNKEICITAVDGNLAGNEQQGCKEIIIQNKCNVEFNAGNGMFFKLSEQQNGSMIISTVGNYGGNEYSEEYANPPIPNGYKHVCGQWNDGFVIERNSDKSQFVWIPVGSLDKNGTLDGENFSEKFGRRNYNEWDDFSGENAYTELMNEELYVQLESVKKYGGFYISRYYISLDQNENLHSVEPGRICNYYNYVDSKKMAESVENTDEVKSHLLYGAEYDSMQEWLLKTNAHPEKTEKWDVGSSFSFDENAPETTEEMEAKKVNNMYVFIEDYTEWTQEKKGKSLYNVLRGGMYFAYGKESPLATRVLGSFKYGSRNTYFRVALTIK